MSAAEPEPMDTTPSAEDTTPKPGNNKIFF